MKSGVLKVVSLVVGLGLPGSLFPVAAGAQEDDLEPAIAQTLSSAAIRELQAQANAEPPKTTNTQDLCVFYHKRGVARYRLGDYPRAMQDLRLALSHNLPSVYTPLEWGFRWRIQNDLNLVLNAVGDWFAVIDFALEVAQEYERVHAFRYHSRLLTLSRAYSALGNFADAEKALKQANDTIPRMQQNANEWSGIGFGHMYQNSSTNAAVLERQGNHAAAERLRRVALDYAQKSLDVQKKIRPPGHVWIPLAANSLTSAKVSLADVLATQGKYGEAEVFARAGLEDRLARYGFNTTTVSQALSVVGWTRFQQGDLDKAEKFYRHAVAALQRSGAAPQSTTLAARRAALANTLVAQSRWRDALQVFEERVAGLKSDAEQSKRVETGHVSWAYALHKTGQSQRAGEMAETMISNELGHTVVNRWDVVQLRGVLGMALAASGNAREALNAFRQSVPDLIRRDYDDTSDEDSGYSRAFWQKAILEEYLGLLAKLQASGSGPADLDLIDESFWVADIARGSSVQQAIAATAVRAQLPDKNLGDLARKEQDALNRIVALNRILSGLAGGSPNERTAKILSDMRAEIERLRKEHVSLRADVRKRYPAYADLIDPRPAGISDVRKALAQGEALVSIYVGETQSYVWTIAAGDKAAFRVIPLTRDEIEADVRELRKAMDFGAGSVAQIRPFDLARAHKLYRAFFESDEALWKDAQVLNVIPHGALGELPFALLVTAQSPQPAAGAQSAYADVPWLMRKVAIAQLPSASAFAALRRTPAGRIGRQPFVGFGDPLFTAQAGTGASRAMVRNLAVRKVADTAEAQLSAMASGKGPQQPGAIVATRTLSQAFAQLSALPDTADELREIAATLNADPARDLFLNRQATEKNVKQTGLDNRRVVAFATHGIAPGELTGLDQPALVLSNPALTGDNDNDGFLTMEEVLGLKLDADWVVLSACNTGSADGRGSEAVSGLGRAFFYAGARSLLVSNWAVETTSARLLTTELFKRQAENPQLTRAEALRQSMLDLMGKKAAGGFSYAHPAFWAPFSLVGDGGR